VKFCDGTELELLTAPEARDDLTTLYRRHLESGDGPAFLALMARPAAPSRVDTPVYIFFGRRNQSPTDRPNTHTRTPFSAGDTIVVEGTSGIVEEVELFSTVLNTPDNRRIFMPNNSIFGKVSRTAYIFMG
jgi:Mechanosensitive ion channel, beta-domain